MEEQKIKCTVENCKYNKNKEQRCSLKEIIVTPTYEDYETETADDSMCGSYENIDE